MNLDLIMNMPTAPIIQSYDKRDTILYALGLGFGTDPLNKKELKFVYEGDGFQAMPTFANNLCHPGFWAKEPQYEINWVKLLHAEQALTLHAPLPATGRLRGDYAVSAIEDKGAEKGALLHQIKTLYNDATDEKLATVRSTLFLRGDGGQGGFGDPLAPAKVLPERTPDRSVEIKTEPDQALIYRLSGDWNPLHADPAIAEKAGFPKPILHGLCTNGLAARAILQTYCDFDPQALKYMYVRFSRPVLPGQTLRFEFFEESETELRFRVIAVETGVVVLDRCSASIVGASATNPAEHAMA